MDLADARPDLALHSPIRLVDATAVPGPGIEPDDPGDLVRTCANCGARLDERKGKLVCRCRYFLSCSDDY
jgi:hypothetical protein